MIHASSDKTFTSKVFLEVYTLPQQDLFSGLQADHYNFGITSRKLNLGAIIGSVVIKDCVGNHSSPWALKGHFHWVLENVILFPEPVPAKGKISVGTFHENWGRPLATIHLCHGIDDSKLFDLKNKGYIVIEN